MKKLIIKKEIIKKEKIKDRILDKKIYDALTYAKVKLFVDTSLTCYILMAISGDYELYNRLNMDIGLIDATVNEIVNQIPDELLEEISNIMFYNKFKIKIEPRVI